MTHETSYRPDIDGLRAIAVLSVVLYHFGVPPFSGGFTGVDVFFVISGYLITSIILQEIRMTNGLSLIGFYDRRIRRILPALAFVTLCSLAAGYALLLPDDYYGLAKQAIASVTGLANFYFFYTMGYFDRSADMLPMLHTWSLAVEEQFYLIWPILLAITVRYFGTSKATLSSLLCCIIISSFAFAVYSVAIDESAFAFYMTPTRAWQLALGALLVLAPPAREKFTSELIATIGMLLIAYGAFMLDGKDPFPGINALYPSIGAALVIWPKRYNTSVSRILATSPFVGIGLISYSLYLWHWPLLVYFKIYSFGNMPRANEIAWLLLASILLAALTWAYIEKPFRRRNSQPLHSVLSGSAGIAAIASLGLLISHNNGFPDRLPSDAIHLAKFLDYKRPPGVSKCKFNSKNEPTCDSDLRHPHVLLIGDSHASHFSLALANSFPDVNFSKISASGCRPVLESKGKPKCVERIKLAYDKHIPETKFDAIVVAARWRSGQYDLIPKSVQHLQNHTDKIIIFGQTMEWSAPLPSILVRNHLPRRGDSIETLSQYDKMKSIDVEIKNLIKGTKAQYYSILDTICPKGKCKLITKNNIPMQWDYGHLTYEGAYYVIQNLKNEGLNFSHTKTTLK